MVFYQKRLNFQLFKAVVLIGICIFLGLFILADDETYVRFDGEVRAYKIKSEHVNKSNSTFKSGVFDTNQIISLTIPVALFPAQYAPQNDVLIQFALDKTYSMVNLAKSYSKLLGRLESLPGSNALWFSRQDSSVSKIFNIASFNVESGLADDDDFFVRVRTPKSNEDSKHFHCKLSFVYDGILVDVTYSSGSYGEEIFSEYIQATKSLMDSWVDEDTGS